MAIRHNARLVELLAEIDGLAVPLRDPEPLREIVRELLASLIKETAWPPPTVTTPHT